MGKLFAVLRTIPWLPGSCRRSTRRRGRARGPRAEAAVEQLIADQSVFSTNGFLQPAAAVALAANCGPQRSPSRWSTRPSFPTFPRPPLRSRESRLPAILSSSVHIDVSRPPALGDGPYRGQCRHDTGRRSRAARVPDYSGPRRRRWGGGNRAPKPAPKLERRGRRSRDRRAEGHARSGADHGEKK